MNPASYVKRVIYAILACAIIVFVLNGAVQAFAPELLSKAQIHFIDVLIGILGLCYVVWGDSLFKSTP